MASFSQQIFSGSQPLEFYFNRISTSNGHKCHIRVKESFQMIHFTMERAGEHWHIIQAPAPEQWILVLEKELEEAILNHEESG